MLSVLMVTQDGEEERLARTLAFLVPAAVEGVVREVIVVASIAAEGVAAVAEHAGCRTAVQLAQGAETARSEWLLFLRAGTKLDVGWMEEVSRHLAGKGGPARFSPERGGWLGVLKRFQSRRGLADGLLIRRREAMVLVTAATDGQDFAKRLKASRLRARILLAT